MRVSCSTPVDQASKDLARRLVELGLKPIVTSQVVRVVYEGPSRVVGDIIVEIFQREADHEITVDYTAKEKKQIEKESKKKASSPSPPS